MYFIFTLIDYIDVVIIFIFAASRSDAALSRALYSAERRIVGQSGLSLPLFYYLPNFHTNEPSKPPFKKAIIPYNIT